MPASIRRPLLLLACVLALAPLAGCGLFGGEGKPVPGIQTPKVVMKQVQKDVGEGIRSDTENRAYSSEAIPPQ